MNRIKNQDRFNSHVSNLLLVFQDISVIFCTKEKELKTYWAIMSGKFTDIDLAGQKTNFIPSQLINNNNIHIIKYEIEKSEKSQSSNDLISYDWSYEGTLAKTKSGFLE